MTTVSEWELPAIVTVLVCALGWLAGRPHRRAVRETEAREARYATLPCCGRCGVRRDPEEGLHECTDRAEEPCP